MENFLNNIILGISLTLPLGPVTLEILRRGIQLNLKESLKTAAGAFAGELTYFSIVYFGLGKFAETFFVKTILGSLGILILLYLGIINIKDYFSKKQSKEETIINKNSILAGYLITVINPLNFFMWAGIIGGAFAKNISFFENSGILVGILSSLITIALFSQLGQSLKKKNKIKYVSLFAGLFLTFYGIKLFFEIFQIKLF